MWVWRLCVCVVWWCSDETAEKQKISCAKKKQILFNLLNKSNEDALNVVDIIYPLSLICNGQRYYYFCSMRWRRSKRSGTIGGDIVYGGDRRRIYESRAMCCALLYVIAYLVNFRGIFFLVCLFVDSLLLVFCFDSWLGALVLVRKAIFFFLFGVHQQFILGGHATLVTLLHCLCLFLRAWFLFCLFLQLLERVEWRTEIGYSAKDIMPITFTEHKIMVFDNIWFYFHFFVCCSPSHSYNIWFEQCDDDGAVPHRTNVCAQMLYVHERYAFHNWDKWNVGWCINVEIVPSTNYTIL